MDLQISDSKATPLYHRIAEAVCEGVVSGRIAVGAKLPAHLSLAKSLGVNPLTVSRGYGLLESRGIVRQRRGSGTYVEHDALRRVTHSSSRRIATIVVALGETSPARCRRETLFIVTDILDGIREVIGNRDTRVTFVESFTSDCLGHLNDDDAVILFAPKETDAALSDSLIRGRIPIVSVGEHVIAPSVPLVYYDRQQSATLACQHLVECGYKRIGFIGVKAYRSAPISPKFYVFTSLLQESGLDIHARYVRDVSVDPGKAYAATREILQTGDVPEAFFVDTDYKAMEVICALNDAGLKVPQDVGIVSYDDTPEAAVFSPPLTTVRVPRGEIGRRAARMLFDWPGDKTVPENVKLKSELVVRKSTIDNAP